jgi:hypothetical protein
MFRVQDRCRAVKQWTRVTYVAAVKQCTGHSIGGEQLNNVPGQHRWRTVKRTGRNIGGELLNNAPGGNICGEQRWLAVKQCSGGNICGELLTMFRASC